MSTNNTELGTTIHSAGISFTEGFEAIGTIYDADRHIAITSIAHSLNEIECFQKI